MITLHTFPREGALESVSPFCMKVEVYLKLAGIPYRTSVSDPRRAPKGKLPYVETEGDGVVSDSDAIIAHFEEQREASFDRGITVADAALSHVVRRTLEEGLYFVLLWARWAEDSGWAVMKTHLGLIPPAVRWAVAPVVRRTIVGSIRAQGTGRHSRDEIYALGTRDLAALSALLGTKPFFLGDELRTVDISAYAFLANVLELDSPLRAALQAHENLVDFVGRVRLRSESSRAS